MKLSIKQTKCLDLLQDKSITEIVFGGGAGGGKSILGCYWICKMAKKYPGTRWVIGRKELKVLKETTLKSLYQIFKFQGLKKDIHYKYNDVKSIFTFSNGSEIILKDLALKPSDPDFDELGSLEITGAFVDECNQIVVKAWKVLKSRIRFMLDEYKLIPKIFGTCNPSKGWVFADFFSLSQRNELPKYKAFLQSLLADNPFISKHYRENLLTLDKKSKERLLYGNWNYDDDPNVLCEYDAICDIFTNEHVQPTGVKRISADLAMQGRDKFVAGSWDGLIGKPDLIQKKSTGKSIESDLKNLMINRKVPRSHTIVDSDGMGNYLESYLNGIKEFHGGSRAVNHLEYFNCKSECAYKLAEIINNREIRIICDDEVRLLIIEELSILKSISVNDDEKRKRIISKEDMKELLGRSPDFLDWLIMRMWFECRTPEPSATIMRRQTNKPQFSVNTISRRKK